MAWFHQYLAGFYFFTIVLVYLWLSTQAATVSQQSSTGGFLNCTRQCGNVIIRQPFGIEPGCFTNTWFQVTCNQTKDGPKPFISRINMEFIGWSWFSSDGTGGIEVNSPVTHVDCNNMTAAFNALNKPDCPFYFSTRSNVFGSTGCGKLVTIYDNRSNPISGILQPTCDSDGLGLGGSYSYAMTSANLTDYSAAHHLTSYTAKLTKISQGSGSSSSSSSRCRSSVFMFGKGMTYRDLALPHDINISTTYVPAILEWNRVECNLESILCQAPGVVPHNSTKCTEKCGDVVIPYPFGIEPGCFKDEWFQVTCDKTTPDEPKAFLSRLKQQILSISFYDGTVNVNNSVTYFNCPDKHDTNEISIDLTDSPFFFSNIENRFGSVGCGNLVTIYHNRTDHLYRIGGCMQPRCSDNLTSNAGCLMTIPPAVSSFVVDKREIDLSLGNGRSNKSCGSAFMVDIDSLDDDEGKIFEDPSHVSTALEWATPTYGLCELAEGSNITCSPDKSSCWSNLSSMHLCVCNKNDSAYFSMNVCQDAGKCGNPTYRNCFMLCLNTPGKHCPSLCPDRYDYDIKENMCKPKVEALNSPPAKRSREIIIGCSTSIGTIIVLIGAWFLYKVLKRRKNIKLKQKYFKRNGGLLLQQQLSTKEGNVEKIQLFTSKELEKATDYYNENRILGQGGQGTVYKGMLTNGSIVAVKKSKMGEEEKLDENKIQQFINEVIILSQINHRNVVKLLGCCLETKVPLLVYEFIPNGTLSELIHNQQEEFPLTWELRFRIAIEIANALSYLHSAASLPIYHRDIKSSNILLDDKYRAKVSDFGTSRSVSLEQTHLTTRVQGTFGYLDPEYFRSNQFTEKSDVYSFGVVLVELLTGQKPVSSSSKYSEQSGEVRSLVPFFLLSMKKNSLSKILDSRLANDAPQEEIIAVAKLAKRCLNLNGKRRPTMKQVATELELIRASKKASTIHQQSDEDDDDSDREDMIQPWAVTSCSTMAPKFDGSVTLSLLDTTDYSSPNNC